MRTFFLSLLLVLLNWLAFGQSITVENLLRLKESCKANAYAVTPILIQNPFLDGFADVRAHLVTSKLPDGCKDAYAHYDFVFTDEANSCWISMMHDTQKELLTIIFNEIDANKALLFLKKNGKKVTETTYLFRDKYIKLDRIPGKETTNNYHLAIIDKAYYPKGFEEIICD